MASISSSSTTSVAVAVTTTTATSTSTTTKSPRRPQTSPFSLYPMYTTQSIPIRPLPPPPPPTQSSSNLSPHQQGILYPVASSDSGFIPRLVRPPDHSVTVANTPVAYHPRAAVGVPFRPAAIGAHPHLDSGLPQNQNSHSSYQHSFHMIKQHPTHLPHQHYGGGGGAFIAPIKEIPVPAQQLKAASATSAVSDSNGYKNLRDRGRDDTLVTVRDRKVRISDDASPYVLCRSWLRNGLLEENQPHCGDVVKSLPRPLPMPVVGTHSPTKEGEEKVEEDEEDEESVDHLSAQDLLKRHIKRAKKVRARLRERRLQRIARYKTRLALLLPPQVEQLRNDTAAGN